MPTTTAITTTKAVIVYGPQGCGKTRHAAAIAAHFGKTTIIDDWEIGSAPPDNALCLTNDAALRGVSATHADTAIFRSAILASVKAAIVECPIPASDDRYISARTRAFASFLSGYLGRSTPELAEAIFSIFKKSEA